MNKKVRRRFSAGFKAKVALEALQERESIESLCKKYDLHPNQLGLWKKELEMNIGKAFSKEHPSGSSSEKLIEELYKQIGQLKVANDWLKKSCNDTIERAQVTCG